MYFETEKKMDWIYKYQYLIPHSIIFIKLYRGSKFHW